MTAKSQCEDAFFLKKLKPGNVDKVLGEIHTPWKLQGQH